MEPSERLRSDPSETFLQLLPGVVRHVDIMRLFASPWLALIGLT